MLREELKNIRDTTLYSTASICTAVTSFAPKTNKVIGDWRKLHNEELHNFYSSPSSIRMICMGRDEKCVQNFGWKA
jgi:hypothetical protein